MHDQISPASDQDFFADTFHHYLQSFNRELSSFSSNQLFIKKCQYLLRFSFFNAYYEKHLLYEKLLKIASSDLVDFIEGGFFSTTSKSDNFNNTKSLIINVQFIELFSNSASYFFEGVFSELAINTSQWTINNLQKDDGCFYNGLNSDEIKLPYYSTNLQHLKSGVNQQSFDAFTTGYKSSSESPERLLKTNTDQQIATQLSMHIKQVPIALESSRQYLLSLRNNKQSPKLNQSICYVSNARMISTLLKCAQLLNQSDFAFSALKALDGLQLHFKNSTSDNVSITEALQLTHTLLTRLSYQWNDEDYQWLLQISRQLNIGAALVYDAIIIDNHSQVLSDLYDLQILTSDSFFINISQSIIAKIIIQINSSNTANVNPTLLLNLHAYNNPPKIIIIRGSKHESTYWSQQCGSEFNPHVKVYAIDPDSHGPDPGKFPMETSIQATVIEQDKTPITINTLSELVDYI